MKKIKCYCEYCGKETEHKRKYDFKKSFIDGFLMNYTKGLSLMFDNTILLQCTKCNNIIEIEVDD